MNDIKRIYISGGITNVPDYFEKFEAAELWLADHGYAPINPARINGEIPKEADFAHMEYMAICRELLRHVDGIYMLKDWQHSVGAKEELCQVLERYPEYEIMMQE